MITIKCINKKGIYSIFTVMAGDKMEIFLQKLGHHKLYLNIIHYLRF